MFKIQFEIKSKMTAYVWAISGYAEPQACDGYSDGEEPQAASSSDFSLILVVEQNYVYVHIHTRPRLKKVFSS